MSATAPAKRRPSKHRGPTPPKAPAEPGLTIDLRDSDGRPIEIIGDGLFKFASTEGPIIIASAARTRLERPFLTMRIAAASDDEGNISTDLVVKLIMEAVKIGGDKSSLDRIESLGPRELGRFMSEWNRFSGVDAGK